MLKDEYKRIEQISKDRGYLKGLNTVSLLYAAKILSRYMKKGPILEIGPAEGIMTDLLAKKYSDVTILEGSFFFCQQIEKKHPNLTVINKVVEEYRTDKKFRTIILGHVLEHIKHPVSVLSKVKRYLASDGIIFTVVPNATSIHRQLGVIMGMLKDTTNLNPNDVAIGHRRVYTLKALRKDFIQAGLKIKKIGGYWIKPLPNEQIEKICSKRLINAFMQLGEYYPEIAAEIYLIARK